MWPLHSLQTFPSQLHFLPASQSGVEAAAVAGAAAGAAAAAAALGGDHSAGILRAGCLRIGRWAGLRRALTEVLKQLPPAPRFTLSLCYPASPAQKFWPEGKIKGVTAERGVETWATDMTLLQLLRLWEIFCGEFVNQQALTIVLQFSICW